MSDMTKQEQVLFERIYIPALIKTCAARGVSFSTNEELNDFIEIAAMVDAQTTAVRSGVIKQANQTLKRQLGVDKAEATMAAETTIKTAAAEFSAQPEILDAILGSVK